MILHIVGLSLRPETDLVQVQKVMAGLAALQPQLSGWVGFAHGPNLDLEGLSPELDYGFVCTFDHRADLERYAMDARHKALGAELVALCQGGKAGIKVVDIAVAGDAE